MRPYVTLRCMVTRVVQCDFISIYLSDISLYHHTTMHDHCSVLKQRSAAGYPVKDNVHAKYFVSVEPANALK